MQGVARLGLLIVVAVMLNGCSWLMSDVTKVDMRIITGGDVNPDDGGRPSPVVVRLIELKSASTFQSADFFALYNDPKQTLGPDLVSSEEFEFKPGDVQDLRFSLHPDSGFVGVMAAYRQLDKVTWRMILPIRLREKNQLTVLLNRRGIELARNN